MQNTERQTFKITKSQKQTLLIMSEKYKINVSEFIRNAINEKLQREKDTIYKRHKEIKQYICQINECPF